MLLYNEHVSSLIERIYDSVIAPEEHDRVLHEVLQATNSHFMLVTAMRVGEPAATAPRFIGELTSRMLDGIADYQAGAAEGDLTVSFMNANPAAGVFATDIHLTQAVHARHPYVRWNKHYLGNAHWMAHFKTGQNVSFGASLHPRSADQSHTCEERDKFTLLFAHIERAWQLATRPADLGSQTDAISIVNQAGHAKAMSPAAVHLADTGDGLELRRGELLPSDRRLWPAWRDAIFQASRSVLPEGAALLLPRRHGARPLAATIDSAPRQAGFGTYQRDVLIRITDRAAAPRNAATKLKSLWGLTPAEARLVQSLVRNDFALRETADQLGITYATVRTHLASVFAKTETASQPELLKLIMLILR